MKRTMLQVYVKNSEEAVETYARAFDAEILCVYPDARGGYMHSELNAYGQIIAVSELYGETNTGSVMQFCFHFEADEADKIERAYEILREGATIIDPLGPCDYSSFRVTLIDRFGVNWCMFL